jgi:hypothetical protein
MWGLRFLTASSRAGPNGGIISSNGRESWDDDDSVIPIFAPTMAFDPGAR